MTASTRSVSQSSAPHAVAAAAEAAAGLVPLAASPYPAAAAIATAASSVCAASRAAAAAAAQEAAEASPSSSPSAACDATGWRVAAASLALVARPSARRDADSGSPKATRMAGAPAPRVVSTASASTSAEGATFVRRIASANTETSADQSRASPGVRGGRVSMRVAPSGHVAATSAAAPGAPNARTPRSDVVAASASACVLAAASRARDVIADDAGDAQRSCASAMRANARSGADE